MTIKAIWAQNEAGVIGDGYTLLWHVPEDLKRFSDLTTGNTVIMGRKTWESLPSKYRPLPDRKNIVVSKTVTDLPGAEVHENLYKVLQNENNEDLWVIGGGSIYRNALPYVDEIYVTRVFLPVNNGLVTVPDYSMFKCVETTPKLTSVNNTEYQFEKWVRNDG